MLRVVAIILGMVLAAWGGVIAYRILFLETGATIVANTGTGSIREYPDLLRAAPGLMMLVGGACIAFSPPAVNPVKPLDALSRATLLSLLPLAPNFLVGP